MAIARFGALGVRFATLLRQIDEEPTHPDLPARAEEAARVQLAQIAVVYGSAEQRERLENPPEDLAHAKAWVSEVDIICDALEHSPQPDAGARATARALALGGCEAARAWFALRQYRIAERAGDLEAAGRSMFLAGLHLYGSLHRSGQTRLELNRRGGPRTKKSDAYLAAAEAQPGVKRASIDYEISLREQIEPESVARGRQRAARRRKARDRT